MVSLSRQVRIAWSPLPPTAIRFPAEVYYSFPAVPFQLPTVKLFFTAVILSAMFFTVLTLLAIFIALFTSSVQAQESASAAASSAAATEIPS